MRITSWDWLKERLKKWFSYLVILSVGLLGFFFFRIINWTKVEGKDNFRQARKKYNGNERRNVLIVSNHLTMFDSFVVGIIAYFPEIIFWPSIAPYHFAAQENYFKFKIVRLLLYCLNALPVNPSRKDSAVMKKALTLLPEANLHIFPGAGRSKKPLGSNSLRPIKGGIGYILTNAPNPKPLVIPVWIGGVDKIFGGRPGDNGKARWFPRFGGIFRRPLVKFGSPINWRDIVQEKGNKKEAWIAIAQRVAESIDELSLKHKSD